MHEIYSHPAPSADFNCVKCIEGYEKIKAEYSAYLSDESKISSMPFNYLFFPKNEGELAAVIREMGKQNVHITLAGARTGLVGGSVPQDGALISLEHFDQVEAVYFDPFAEEWRVRAQCAISLKSLDGMLKFKQFPILEQSQDASIREEFKRFKEDPNSYFYPPDPTEMSASLGGSVVTNASGARTYRYGPTRAWVRGIRVILANGEVVDIPRGKYFASPAGKFIFYNSKGEARSIQIPNYPIPKTKSTTGIFTASQMDLVDLFIGSEGVFGIITRVDVALLKREEKISIILFLDSDEQAIQLTNALRADARLQLDFLEFYSINALNLLRERQKAEPSTVGMPSIPAEARAALFIEMNFDPRAEALDFHALDETIRSCGASLKHSWAGYESRELDRFKVFRHMVPETINDIIAQRKKVYPSLHKLGTDLAIPDEHLVEMWQLYKDQLEASGLEWLAFGHIGNNHIHVNVIPRDLEELRKGLEIYAVFAQKAVELGGAVSAEHGVGKIKGKFLKLMYSPEQVMQMKQVKDALDPLGLLNPGDIFTI
jgi:D-lactate dehydrogenase (cytochrome)